MTLLCLWRLEPDLEMSDHMFHLQTSRFKKTFKIFWRQPRIESDLLYWHYTTRLAAAAVTSSTHLGHAEQGNRTARGQF